ncbi:MAG: VOC family protein [Rhodothermales bacterium]|nr:VOC family protein [Rhodothermales bacterium]
MNRPIHFEILADNPQELSAFYSRVLGWKVSLWDGPQTYWSVDTGDDEKGINGAFMHRHFEQSVINTSEVESLEQAINVVEENGGRIVLGPNDIPGVGRHAYCADPEGNIFGLMQPGAAE